MEENNNCINCVYPCRLCGNNLKPITYSKLLEELDKRGYVICEDYTDTEE